MSKENKLPDDWQEKFMRNKSYALGYLIHNITVSARSYTYLVNTEDRDVAIEKLKLMNEDIHHLSTLICLEQEEIWMDALEQNLKNLIEHESLSSKELERIFALLK